MYNICKFKLLKIMFFVSFGINGGRTSERFKNQVV